MPEEYFRLGYGQIPLLGPAGHKKPCAYHVKGRKQNTFAPGLDRAHLMEHFHAWTLINAFDHFPLSTSYLLETLCIILNCP